MLSSLKPFTSTVEELQRYWWQEPHRVKCQPVYNYLFDSLLTELTTLVFLTFMLTMDIQITDLCLCHAVRGILRVLIMTVVFMAFLDSMKCSDCWLCGFLKEFIWWWTVFWVNWRGWGRELMSNAFIWVDDDYCQWCE